MILKRINYLDCVKGLGIMLVILAHIYAYDIETKRSLIVIWSYSFHMPLFFIVTGMLIRFKDYTDIRKFIISRIKCIMIPYFIFGFFNTMINFYFSNFELESLFENLYDLFILKGVDMWFLQTLFIAEITFVVLKEKIKNQVIRLGIVVGLFISAFFVTVNDVFLLQFLARVFISIGFIEMGYILMIYMDKIKVNNWILVGLLVVQVILAYSNGFVDLNNLVFNNPYLYFVNSALGAIAIIVLFKNVNIDNCIFNYYGRNSLILFVTSGILILIIRKIMFIKMNSYLNGAFVLGIILLLEIPIIHLLNNYFGFALGRFEKEKNKFLLPVLAVINKIKGEKI